jgi:hypothetical protein
MEILEKIRAFPRIVLRGAGSCGWEVYELLRHGVGIEETNMCFWDLNPSGSQYMGIPVLPLFSMGYDPAQTLIIHCIGASVPYDSKEYAAQGYIHSVDGNLFCELYKCVYLIPMGAIPGKSDIYKPNICIPEARCNYWCCPKADRDSWYFPPELLEDERMLIGDQISFEVNTLCTLKCQNCCQYINHYEEEERFNVPFERIRKDIDLVCGAYDFIRMTVVEGGEFFLHPENSRIIQYLLARENVGLVLVATNAVCKIAEDALHAMKHERCIVRVSDYRGNLNEKQRSLFEGNIEKLKRHGVLYNIPDIEWVVPTDLRKKKHSVETMEKMKKACFPGARSRCRVVWNGRLWPCEPAANIARHHLADYCKDNVILDSAIDREDLRSRIRACIKRDFYPSCAHCDISYRPASPGKLGFSKLFSHIGPSRHGLVSQSMKRHVVK